VSRLFRDEPDCCRGWYKIKIEIMICHRTGSCSTIIYEKYDKVVQVIEVWSERCDHSCTKF
jgi:hypothetical protein